MIKVTPSGTSPNARVDEPVQVKASAVSAPAGGRVLMLVENNSYPQDFRVRHEARALAEAGYQVTVISPARPGQRWRETIDGVRVYRYPAPREMSGVIGYLFEYGYSTVALFILSLLVYLREGFDVVHAANPPDTLWSPSCIARFFPVEAMACCTARSLCWRSSPCAMPTT